MTKVTNALLSVTVVAVTACHPGPVLTPKLPADGTIAGIVTTVGNIAVPDRKVTAIHVSTGARYEAITAVNGGYTIRVPEGTYRLEVELQRGEGLAEQPAETKVDKSDLDERRDFTIR